jgi:hypothetical protein
VLTPGAESFNGALQIAAPQRAADCGNVPQSAPDAYLSFRGALPRDPQPERRGLRDDGRVFSRAYVVPLW